MDSNSTSTETPHLNETVQNIIIGIGSLIGGVLLILVTYFIIIRFNLSKGLNNPAVNQSGSHRNRRPRNRISRESPCRFVSSGSLVVVSKGIELAFPDYVTCSVKTFEPLPSNQVAYYFEVEVLQCVGNANITMGFASSSLCSMSMPGFSNCSASYGSLDGQFYIHGNLIKYSPKLKFTQGDTVGCGLFPRTGSIIFTKNGLKEDILPYGDPQNVSSNLDLFPAVGSTGSCLVKANFGQKKFLYKEANRNAWGFGIHSTLEVMDLSSPPPVYQSARNSGFDIIPDNPIENELYTTNLSTYSNNETLDTSVSTVLPNSFTSSHILMPTPSYDESLPPAY